MAIVFSSKRPSVKGSQASIDLSELTREAQLIVLAGPSGVGKGTLLARLRQVHPELGVSESWEK